MVNTNFIFIFLLFSNVITFILLSFLQKTNDKQVTALACRYIYEVHYILLSQIENPPPHILDNEVVTKLFLFSFRDNFIIFLPNF